MKDVWSTIREDLANQSEIRFGWLRSTYLHTLLNDKIYIAYPKEFVECANSHFMEQAKLDIKNKIYDATGLFCNIRFEHFIF